MIVICEECGKKYRIDPSRVKGPSAKFKCKVCSHIITVTPTPSAPQEPPPPPFIEPEPDASPAVKKERKKLNLNIKTLGLRGKMIILFFILPILMMVLMGWFYINQLGNLTEDFKKEGLKVVNDLAVNTIATDARTTAELVGFYLKKHPELKKEEFIDNEEFMKIAYQKVGKTGYTALYSFPDKDGIWRTWAHPLRRIIGIDMTTLKNKMGQNFSGFWKVYKSVTKRRESKGYYTWQEKDNSFREKYMVCTPVKGTPYIIAATTYLDEFTKPMTNLRRTIDSQVRDTRFIVFTIFGISLIIGGFIVYWYSTRLSGRIAHLTQVAERISVGEMEEEIKKDSNDEIGALGEAISRMQDSIRLSIERLRQRR